MRDATSKGRDTLPVMVYSQALNVAYQNAAVSVKVIDLHDAFALTGS